jgi:hypothetical protein
MECFLDEKDLLTLVKSEPVYEQPAEEENAQQLAARQQRNDALRKKDKRYKNMIVQKIAESHTEYAMNKVSAYEV